jgi:hypothetical protein
MMVGHWISIALSQAMQELIPLHCLLLELVTEMNLPGGSKAVLKATMFEDKSSVIATAVTMKIKPLTKLIATKYQQENMEMKNLKSRKRKKRHGKKCSLSGLIVASRKYC